MTARRLRYPLMLVVAATTCAAVLLPGPAASSRVAAGSMQVDFSFSAVGGKRPPNIVETRIVGKGRLAFDQAPDEGTGKRADSASGTVVVEYDILTPHPRTVRLTLKVTRASYKGDRTGNGSALFRVKVVKTNDGDGSAVESCPIGSEGALIVQQARIQSAYYLTLGPCDIKHGQTATTGSNSRIRIDFRPKCLKARTPAARKPLCGSSKGTTKPKPPTPPAQTGSFKLVPGLTEVKNARPPELTINASGGTAVWDHTGQFGGAGKGGEWKVDFKWNVPPTLTPGKSSPLTLGLQVSSVVPEQPILFQIGARAYDFKQGIDLPYPNPTGATKTFSIPVSTSYKDYKDLFVIVDLVGAEVIYHYRK